MNGFTVKYDHKPSNTKHLFCQCRGVVCRSVKHFIGEGTTEIWEPFVGDPVLYPLLPSFPVNIWTDTTTETMKTLNEQYALAMPKIGRPNRKRHTLIKTIALRLAVSLTIAGAIYWTLR